MKRAIVLGLVLLFIIFGGGAGLGYALERLEARSQPTPVASAFVGVEVVQAHFQACNAVCGELMPFVAEVTKDGAKCSCMRPAPIAKVRVPPPPSRPAVVAQVPEAQQ